MSKSSNSSGLDDNTASSVGAVNIIVIPLDKTSVKILWDKVPDPDVNDPVRRYTICYQLHPGVTQDAKMKKIVDGSILSTKITGLNQATKYYVSVFASTDSEDGPFGNEVEFVTLKFFPGFQNGDIYRFWSYQSKCGDGYICMPTTSNGAGSYSYVDLPFLGGVIFTTFVPDTGFGTYDGYPVNAGGKVEIKDMVPTELTFVQQGGGLEAYILYFQKDNIAYCLSASETDVKAIKYSEGNTTEATMFEVTDLEKPNKPYIVLKKAREDLYLSSDGAGNMKLKASNVDDPPPSFPIDVDPAILFRVVKPPKVVEPYVNH